jgi:hypothetical protein
MNFGGSSGVWTTRSLCGDTIDVEGWFFDDLEKKRFMSYQYTSTVVRVALRSASSKSGSA